MSRLSSTQDLNILQLSFVSGCLCPLSRLAECISASKKLLDASPLTCLVIAHAGDGNLHTIILFDLSKEDQTKGSRETKPFHGPYSSVYGRYMHRIARCWYWENEVPREGVGHRVLRTMKRIKAALDPKIAIRCCPCFEGSAPVSLHEFLHMS
ncbi:unnamed protein product [Urochloa humidicola]